MNPDEYISNALVTEQDYNEELVSRMAEYVRPLHAAIGLCTETGELQDAFKRAIFYGKELDVINLHEEAGDLCWYLAVLIHWIDSVSDGDVSFATVFTTNIKKLQARFGKKFEKHNAIVRDLDKERDIISNFSIDIVEPDPEAIDPLYVKALEKEIYNLNNKLEELQRGS